MNHQINAEAAEMGFFSTMFGTDDKKSLVDQLNVMEAINAHVRWKIRLENYLNGTSDEKLDPKMICLDNQCTLGKWIHGPAKAQFSEDAGFKALLEDHARFHVVASTVVTKIHENDKAAAEELLKGDYSLASRKVVHDLTELSKQLAG